MGIESLQEECRRRVCICGGHGFGEVLRHSKHSKLIEVLSRTIKDGRVISLIHKYLNAGVLQNGFFESTLGNS